MAIIKIESDSLKEAAAKVNTKVTSYQDNVVSSASIFSDIYNTLSGQGYDTLLAQMNSKIESQKNWLLNVKFYQMKLKIMLRKCQMRNLQYHSQARKGGIK